MINCVFFQPSLRVTLKISYSLKDISYIDGYWITRIVFSGRSKGGDVNPKGVDATYYFDHFSRILHEIDKNWTNRDAFPAPPSNPPLFLQYGTAFFILTGYFLRHSVQQSGPHRFHRELLRRSVPHRCFERKQ